MSWAVMQALLVGSARMLDKTVHASVRRLRAWEKADEKTSYRKALKAVHQRDPQATLGAAWMLVGLGTVMTVPSWIPAAFYAACLVVWVFVVTPVMLRKHTRASLKDRLGTAAKIDRDTSPRKAISRLQYTGWLGSEIEHIVKLRLRFGSDFRVGEEKTRNNLESHLRELLKFDARGTERQIEVDWYAPRGYVDIDCEPNIPSFYRLTLEDIECYTSTDRQILIGMGNGYKPIVVDFAKVAHLLVASPTGAGKSNFTRVVAANMFHHILKAEAEGRQPWQLLGMDPKRLGLRFMSGRPGCHWIATDYADMCELVGYLHREMEAWYDRAEHASVLPDLLRIFLFNEELAALGFLEDLEADGNRPVIKQIANLARKGRESGIHMLSIIQQAAAEFIPTEMRGNHEGRLGMTKLPQEASKMLYNDTQVGQHIPAIPGRGLLDLQGERDWVQLAWAPNPDALDLSLEERGMDPKLELRAGQSLFPAKDISKAGKEREHAAAAGFRGPQSH